VSSSFAFQTGFEELVWLHIEK